MTLSMVYGRPGEVVGSAKGGSDQGRSEVAKSLRRPGESGARTLVDFVQQPLAGSGRGQYHALSRPLLHPTPLSSRQLSIMSFSASRMLLRTPQIGRIAARHASTTSEAVNAASKGASQASQGLSKASSSAGSGISKAAGAAGNALNSIGGRTGQLISFVQCTCRQPRALLSIH